MLRSTIPPEAFMGVLVDDRHNLDRRAIGGYIELEVHRPHTAGRIRDDHGRRGRGAVAFASPPLRHLQAFVAPVTHAILSILLRYSLFSSPIELRRRIGVHSAAQDQ
jgi:hypothetical protein